MSCLKLKDEYLKEIKYIENQCKEASKSLMSEERRDEAILENIKLNVIDIFTKMFNISFNKACKDQDNNERLQVLREEYFKFFDKLPAPWKIKLEKNKEHNMMEEYYKEKIKLDMVDEIKEIFTKYYDKYNKEE